MEDLNTPLWTFQVLLAGYFLWNGAKTLRSQTLIGLLQIVGALGLLLPIPLGLPVLTPIAASVLTLLSLYLAVMNGKKGDTQAVMIAGMLIGVTGFVAIGRFLG